jgi:gliding motility-associated-like protein
VKDGAGCKSNPKNAVINSFASTLKATASVTNNTSCLQSTGSVSIAVTGGTSPYQYSIDGGTAQTTNVFTGLAVGPHKVVIKDAAGCTDEVSFTVTQLNSTLSGTATVTNVICDKKGSVSIQATGGVAPYTFSLNGGTFQSSSLFDNLASGQQKVTIKDNLGCVFEVAFEVKQTGSSPTLLITDPPAICPGATLNLKDPSLTKGSEAGLSFTYWTDANATIPVADPTVVTAGRYYIRAMNDVGCSVIKPVVITAISSPAGSVIFSGTPFACTGQVIILTASTGTAYQWYRNDTAIAGATLQIYRATTDGLYSVGINNGTCSVRSANTVRLQFQPCISVPETNVVVPTAFTPNRNGANDVLRPVLYNIASVSYFKVFNRWGQLVFQTNTMNKGWDGTLNGVQQPTETYTWILECTDNSGNIIKKSGRSLLIR